MVLQCGRPTIPRTKIWLKRFRGASRRWSQDWRTSHIRRLRILNLWTLEERRQRSDLIEVYKILHSERPTPLNTLFEVDWSGRTRGNCLKLLKPGCSTDVRKFCFSHRIIDRWNRLPDAVVLADSINSFKSGLDRLRRAKMGFFMDDYVCWAQWLPCSQVWPHLVSNHYSGKYPSGQGWCSIGLVFSPCMGNRSGICS